MPQRGGQAVLIRDANPADMLHLAHSATLPTDDFTVEAFVMPKASTRTPACVIASQWDGKQEHFRLVVRRDERKVESTSRET